MRSHIEKPLRIEKVFAVAASVRLETTIKSTDLGIPLNRITSTHIKCSRSIKVFTSTVNWRPTPQTLLAPMKAASPLAPSSPIRQYLSTERVDIFQRFADDFNYVNEPIISGTLPMSLLGEFLRSHGPAVFLTVFLTAAIAIFCFYSASKCQMSLALKRSILIGAEILAVGIAIVPMFLPFKSMRFVYGLIGFVLTMSIHSHIVSSLPGSQTFLARLLNVFSFNTREFLGTKTPTLPSRAILLRWVYLVILTDTFTFMFTEAVPQYITGQTNQIRAIAVMTGYWIYVSMEFHYTQTIIFNDFMGTPVPMNLRHKNPFLSISLSEFWGVRWNPVVAKLLQTSFYKPLRRLGVSRLLCVVACFAGSAALHTFPVYISMNNSKGARNAAMMGGFFVLMGILVLAEQAFFAAMGWTGESSATVVKGTHATHAIHTGNHTAHADNASDTSSNLSDIATKWRLIKKEKEDKEKDEKEREGKESDELVMKESWSSVIPYISEICEMFSVGGLLFCLVEDKMTFKNILFFSIPLIVTMGCVLYVQLPTVIVENNRVATKKAAVQTQIENETKATLVEDSLPLQQWRDSSSYIVSMNTPPINVLAPNNIPTNNMNNIFHEKKPITPPISTIISAKSILEISCKSVDSYSSVTDVGQLSNPTSRNTSFNNSEKLLEESSEELFMEAAKKLLAEHSSDVLDGVASEKYVDDSKQFLENGERENIFISEDTRNEIIKLVKTSAFVLGGWLWTISIIAILLPLFTLPCYDILDTLFPQSAFIGPLIRTLQYAGWV